MYETTCFLFFDYDVMVCLHLFKDVIVKPKMEIKTIQIDIVAKVETTK